MVVRLPKTGWFSLAIFLECKVASPRGYGSCPRLDADLHVADSEFMKVAVFGVHAVTEYEIGFKMLLFNPLVYVVPTGKDNVIVSTGRSNVIPAGRTILVL
ncbi:hypothetical protein Tco_1560486, partial [Tanacetum coccineum]